MTQKTYLPMPGAPVGYEAGEAHVFRRTLEQNFVEIATDVSNVELAESVQVSKTIRKYQFLLMGVSNG